MNPMGAVNVAFFASDIVNGSKKTGQNIKKQLSSTNKYDKKLGIKIPKITDSGRYSSANTIGSSPLNKTAAIEYLDKKNNKSNDIDAKYLVPAALLVGGGMRAYKTGNSLQLFHDMRNAANKINPVRSLRRSKNPMVRMGSNFDQFIKSENLAAMPTGKKNNSFKAGAEWVAGMTLAEMAVNNLFGPDYKNDKWRDEHKQAKKQQMKQAFVESGFIEKIAREVPGAKGWAQKMLIEGIAQPAISAVPIVTIPAGISLAINKDIKGDFEPVRDSGYTAKRRKINANENDPRSAHNYAVNSEILQVAKEAAKGMTKEANIKPFRNADGTLRMYKIRGWRDFFDEAPLAGLRAASIAVPTTIMLKYDPVSKYKSEQAEKAQKKHEKAIVNKAVNKAVDKAVEQAVEQIQLNE